MVEIAVEMPHDIVILFAKVTVIVLWSHYAHGGVFNESAMQQSCSLFDGSSTDSLSRRIDANVVVHML